MDKTKQVYVLPKLTYCISTTTSFDLWMSKGAHDIFALIINVMGSNWEPKEVTIGLFETIRTIRQALANNLTKLVDQYGLRNKIIVMLRMRAQI